MQVKKLTKYGTIPKKQHLQDAGFDLYSAEDLIVIPNMVSIVHTDIAVKIPQGYVGFVCSRSGLAAKQQVFVLNSPGVIDSNYRGEVLVIIMNLGEDYCKIKKGDRIAQLVVVPTHPLSEMEEVMLLDDDLDRGVKGIGSTGV